MNIFFIIFRFLFNFNIFPDGRLDGDHAALAAHSGACLRVGNHAR